MQLSPPAVEGTHGARALGEGRERALANLLKDLVAARVARVRVDEEERLDLAHARDDAAHGDEVAEVCRADGADGEDGGCA